jgi:hypothetical protein
MILKESEIDKETIHDILGKPFKDPKKWFTVTGSCYYFIKELTDHDGNEILIWEDSKGIFQHHEQGLALYVNRSNYQRVVLIRFGTIETLVLNLIKTDISKETTLQFKTSEYVGTFIANHSEYKSQYAYFSRMGVLDHD